MVYGALIKKGLELSTRVPRMQYSPIQLQRKELKKLLLKASATQFGRHYQFNDILNARSFMYAFRDSIPMFNYNSMYESWWRKCQEEQEDVCWPGKVKYFALSSGTSDSASKHIPVTHDMVKSLKRASIKQILTLSKYNFPASFFEKGILWLGGSTDLKKHGGYYEGDVSGISAKRVPIWFRKFYKPGKKISKQHDWNAKLEQMTLEAKNWDIGIITGVPAWVQLLIERVMDYYQLKSIHEIWPNLQVYVHGGVSFEPYKKSFEKFFSKPISYIELYPASEGFIAFQAEPGVNHMKLVLDNGMFFEFVPFDENNFDDNGELRPGAQSCFINEVEEGKDYAILLSTCAGAWRYLIGDTIKFVNKDQATIVISGRTKHYLSLTGEHLSVDNMNKAIEKVCQQWNIAIGEFAVAGIPHEGHFAHQWYIGTHHRVNIAKIKESLDEYLKSLNDDYAVERVSALKEVFVEVLPPELFYKFLEHKGKSGGQHKFPRVLKAALLKEWKEFLLKQQ
ncbi:MAG: hypothetical protein RIQ89_489 [Bacteroidota bacterium]|jgi:hypothetical protein